MKRHIKQMVNRILFPHNYNSEAYCSYLRKQGVMIGEGTVFINPKECYVDEGRAEYISIGSNCCLSVATILAHDYSWYVLARSHNRLLPDGGGIVNIGNNVFIGYKSTILKGVTIGDNVIVGANSLVAKDIPANTVWAGMPAKQISTLDEYYQKRVASELAEARKRVKVIYDRCKRTPTVEDMGFFAYLFLERTESNYVKYLKKLKFNGLEDTQEIRQLFFGTTPKYAGFKDFLDSCEMIEA